MGGGGKGGSTVAPARPTYTDPVTGRTYNSTSELNAAITAREAEERAASEAADARAEADRLEAQSAFDTRLNDAYNLSRTNINNYFTGLGLDPNLYNNDITSALDTRRQQVVNLDPNPMGTFGTNIGQEIVNSLTNAAQTRARTGLDQVFGTNYSARELPLDLINPVVDQVLNSQFDPLSTQLQNAMLRRTLTEPGYAGALAQMEEDRTAGRSAVNRLGENVIYSDRGDIDSYLNSVYGNASSIPLQSASSFDPNEYYNEAENRTERARNNLYGDVLNAVGPTRFSDITRLLNAGGVAQGAYDPTSTNPNPAIGGFGSIDLLAQDILRNRSRGLGSQGQF